MQASLIIPASVAVDLLYYHRHAAPARALAGSEAQPEDRATTGSGNQAYGPEKIRGSSQLEKLETSENICTIPVQ